MAEGDFHAVDTVDGGVAGRGATEHRDERVGDKAHMHQMVLYGFGQVESHQDRSFTDFKLAENTHLPNHSRGPGKGQNPKLKTRSPEITTRKVGLQYRTKSV